METETRQENTTQAEKCANSDGIFLDILGQRICMPTNLWSAGILSVFFLGVAGIIGILVTHPQETQSVFGTFFVAGRTSASGDIKKFKNDIFSFSTPAEAVYGQLSTEEYLRGQLKNINDPKTKSKIEKRLSKGWYSAKAEDIEEFGNKLKAAGASGFTRWHSWGRGTSPIKPGWTWNVTFPAAKSFTPEKLQEIYKESFNRESKLYITVEKSGA